MSLMIWHAGTGTVMNASECVVVDVPDDVTEADLWISENNPTPVCTFGSSVEETKIKLT